jgi:hypothetical protein
VYAVKKNEAFFVSSSSVSTMRPAVAVYARSLPSTVTVCSVVTTASS